MPSRPVPQLTPRPASGSMPLRAHTVPMDSCVMALIALTKKKQCQYIRIWLKELATVLPELVALVEPLFHIIRYCPCTLEYLKASSQHGYDVHRGRVVDYGNYQYTTVLKMLALENNTICDSLDSISEAVPTLRVTHADTKGALIHQGDLIEALMGLWRCTDDGGFLGIANVFSRDETNAIFHKLVTVSRIVDNIWCICTGPRRTKRGDDLPWECFLQLSLENRLYMGSGTLQMARVLAEFVKSQAVRV